MGAGVYRMFVGRVDFRISQRLARRKEDRIIAKTQRAARRPGQAARRPALENLGMAVGPGEREGADEGGAAVDVRPLFGEQAFDRSEEHTSELQSLMRISYAVFCLKKKKNTMKRHKYTV